MKYDYKEIGKRIARERKSLRLSQEGLIECLSADIAIGRNSLSAIENGNVEYCSLKLLTKLCELFNCELGYLLGEYNCKTRLATDICYSTSLEENAVNELLEAKRLNQFYALKALNELLTSDALQALEAIGQYITTTEPPEIRPNGYTRKAESGYLLDVEQELFNLRERVQKEEAATVRGTDNPDNYIWAEGSK